MDRLTAFGCALLARITTDADLGAALGRQVAYPRRAGSGSGRASHRHVSTLLCDMGLDGDHDMLAHALLAFTSFEAADYLREELGVPTTRLQATWTDLIRRLARSEGT